ncbi:MAG: septation ring formation regulator EzrA [Bacilli bacterium]|nr:septation ring formation regulator EzrA [Bacilli bacterium]
MDGLILQLVTYFIVAIILITVVLNIMQASKSNKYKKNITKLEKDKNSVISSPIMSELNKVEALVKNEKIEEKFHSWQHRFDNIKKVSVGNINDMLLEADFLLDQKDYKPALNKIVNIEMSLYEARTKADNLLGEIQEITLSEEKNRNIITTLKKAYRDLIQIFEKTKDTYNEIANPIELQFENIEKRFQEFETVMENNDYDEVNHIVKAIDDMIKHMQIVIDEVPAIVLTYKSVIPTKIKDIMRTYENMTKDGFQLDYLNVDYNVAEINKKVSDIIDRVKILNLEEAIFELKTFIAYFDNLFNDFEREKLIRKVYEEGVVSLKLKVSKLNDIMSELYSQISDLKYSYDLSNKELETLDSISNDLNIFNEDFKALQQTEKTKSFPYSRLNKERELLVERITTIEEKLNVMLKSLGSMKDDERRAREQLENINDLFKKSKYKMRENKIPVVSSNYYIELKEASLGVKEIIKELEKKPINIETLNTRVDTARDLVFKLHNTTNEMIKTAVIAEMAIVYGNRYRSSKKQVLEGLTKAEILFVKGEYKKSLELSINTIDIVEPGFYRRLLNVYDSQ